MAVTALADRQSVPQAMKLREEIDRLLDRASEIGGETGRGVTANMTELRRILIASCENALADQQEALSAFRKADESYHAGVCIYRNLFVSQMLRKDTPIMKDEIVPALLSENSETIQIALKVSGEEVGNKLLQECYKLVEELRVQGVDVSEWDNKLSFKR